MTSRFKIEYSDGRTDTAQFPGDIYIMLEADEQLAFEGCIWAETAKPGDTFETDTLTITTQKQ